MNVELMDLENPADQRNLVAFRLDQQIYALPIEPIMQIIEMVTITPIPQVSNTVEGIVNVRGTPVPVVNLRRHIGLPEASLQLHTPIVLVQVSERMVGLIVDEVLDVLSLPGGQITRPADILPEGLGEAPILQGVAHIPHDTVLLLDLEHLFLPYQVQALTQAIEALPEAMVEEAPEETPKETQPKPARKRRKKASEELPTETQPEAVIEEAPQETPSETQPKPARRRRKKRLRTKEASEESPVETEPQPARTRRKKRQRTKTASKETHLDKPDREVEA